MFDFRHGRRFRGVLIEERFLTLGGVFGHGELAKQGRKPSGGLPMRKPHLNDTPVVGHVNMGHVRFKEMIRDFSPGELQASKMVDRIRDGILGRRG